MFVIEVLLRGEELFDYIQGKDQDQIADEILKYIHSYSYYYSHSQIVDDLSP